MVIQGSKRIYKLDLLKGAACVGVVFTHVTFPGLWGKAVMRAAGFAVPVFFMIAGYFAYGKGRDVIWRRLIKILGILAAGYGLYFSYHACMALRSGALESWLLANFDMLTPIRYLVFCDVGFAVHLWYLIAMAETYGLWLLISKHGWQQMSVRCLPVLFILQFILVIYCDTYDLPWALQVNFLLRALPWFLLGYEIRAGEKQMVEMPEKGRMAELLKNDRMLCGLAFVGLLIAVLPSVFDLPLKFNAIGYVPYSAALFLLAIKKPDRRTSRLLEYIGGRLSMYVYVLHVLMAGAAKELMMRLLGAEFLLTSAYEWTWPLATLMISIVVAALLDQIRKKERRHIRG